MIRLTSDFFVSQLMRRIAVAGGFAAVVKKGASEAGAVYIIVRARSGAIQFYGPAPQLAYQQDYPTDRYFIEIESVSSEADISAFVTAETRFDPDFWLVELETDINRADLPFETMRL